MFEQVGRHIDPGANTRKAQSAFLISTVGLATAAALVAIGSYHAASATLDAVEIPVDVVEIAFQEEEMAPAPAPPKIARGVRTPAPEERAQASEPSDKVAPLPDQVPDEVRSTAPPAGDPNGALDGDPDGVPDGSPLGVPGGTDGGTGSGPRTVHHRDVEVKRQRKPVYPEAARGMDLGDQSCVATLFISTKGVPYRVHVEACPPVFQDAAERALTEWRFYPYRAAGKATKAQFRLKITFRER